MSESTITIRPTINVDLPPDKVIINRDYLAELEERADMTQWWTMHDIKDRYKRSPTWFTDHVLTIPRFEKILRDRVVMYPDVGGSYLFLPTQFAKFMQDYFPEICRELERGKR